MRKSIFGSLQDIFLTVTALTFSSCGGGNNLENLRTDVNMVSERIAPVVKESPEAAGDFSMNLTEQAVTFDASVAQNLFDLKMLDPNLAEFAIASYLHVLNPDGNRNAEVADMINNMAKNELPLAITLTQGDYKFNQQLEPARLKTLFKEALTNLNRSGAAANAAKLTGSWAEKVFKTEGASEFECIYSTNQIIINVTYPDVNASPLKGVTNATPALKGMFIDAAEAHYAKYGALRPAITALMIDLGVKELRLTYKYADGKAAPSVRLQWGKDL